MRVQGFQDGGAVYFLGGPVCRAKLGSPATSRWARVCSIKSQVKPLSGLIRIVLSNGIMSNRWFLVSACEIEISTIYSGIEIKYAGRIVVFVVVVAVA